MGCASSTPMIQTTGSEMLKAATHVAADATKTAEDAVQGVKDTVGKTLESAKDSAATTMEGVKHEVENVVKEKTEMLEDAKNSLMEKLHLSEATKNANDELVSKAETATEMASVLNENLKQDEKDDIHTAQHENEGTATTSVSDREHVLMRTDTETDSLKTSTPEPEIEQALANCKKSNNNSDDDDGDNPPTPKPTLSELENLTAEAIQQQQLQNSTITPTMVNDISMNNDQLMTTIQDSMKSTDTMKAIKSTIEANNTTPTSLDKQTLSNTMHKKSPPPLLPLPITTTAIATATTQTRKETQLKQKPQPQPHPQQKSKKAKPIKQEEIVVNGKPMNSNTNANVEKRPGTTEWEKFADILAQHRKHNPQDAFRRGGTLTKFGGNGHIGGAMPLRPSYVGHHMRGSGGDDDSSDTTSNWRGSPQNSQRSSARAGGRIQRLPNRPNTGNQRKNNHEFSSTHPGQKNAARRNSIIIGNGRKFDYNPTRSRLNDYTSTVSSIPYTSSQPSSLQPALNTQLPYAPSESVKSPSKMRSHHSRLDTKTPHHLEPLERPRSRSQQQPQHFSHEYTPNDSNVPFQSTKQNQFTETLTRESSNTSLFSNGSYVDNMPSLKSSLDLRALSTNPPLRNTSSFLATPRCSPFSVRKSYTDLYFSSTSNKENKNNLISDVSSVAKQRNLKDKSPYKVRKRCEVCSKKFVIK